MNKLADGLLSKHYLNKGESSSDGYLRAAVAYCFGDKQLAARINSYVDKKWCMYSSPVLSNAPDIVWPEGKSWEESRQWLIENKNNIKLRGLPISCFLQYMADTKKGIVDTWAETAHLTYAGGGVGIHCRLRGNEGKSTGAVQNLHVTDAQMLACLQADVRRGSAAAYLDVTHPEILEFLEMRVPAGSANRKNLNMHHAVNITDEFMEAVRDDRHITLSDNVQGHSISNIRARDLWERILETRFRTGEPYLNFITTANGAMPESQRAAGLQIYGSNLCNEIHLATNDERTAVCCLSSLNLEYYDEWKDTNIVRDLIRFLDNVLEFFIIFCPEEMAKARYSAQQERALGLGGMGFHSYLQAKGIPWETALAVSANKRIFKHIKEQALEETYELAKERGEAPDMVGTGRRNSHLLAIAPNANSSILVGCSPSIEPWNSNVYTHQTRAGSDVIWNKHLWKLLEERVHVSLQAEVIKDLLSKEGSVQHVDWLNDYEKDVFKTAFEIDQRWVIQHAVDRQPYICQGQSVNVFFPAGADRRIVAQVHYMAWKGKLKGMYYLRTKRLVNPENVSMKVERSALNDTECLACHS